MKVNLYARTTKDCKCRICGGVISTISDCVSVQGLKGYASNDKNAYFHKNCFYPKRYHASDRRENISGIRNNFSELRLGDISSEFEVVSENDDFEYDIINDEAYANVYVTLLGFGSKANNGIFQQSTQDCTVTSETPCRGRNLYGTSKWLHERTEEELDMLRNERCGAHIHVTANHCGSYSARRAYEVVLERISNLSSQERIKIFGSDFREYAGDEVSLGSHCAAINCEPSTGCTIEFRLARVRTADQYIEVCKWWRATVNVVNKYIWKVNNGQWTPEQLGQKAAKQFDRLLSGAFRKGE